MRIRIPEDEGIFYQRITYPAGEQQVRLINFVNEISIAKRIDVWARAASAENLMTLVLLTDALHEINRRARMDLWLAYLPYGRADRRFTVGDCFGLRAFGNIIDSLGYGKVHTLDVHSTAARSEIANLLNHAPDAMIQTVANELGGATYLAPDYGARTRYGISLYCKKHRDASTGRITRIEVPAENVMMLPKGSRVLVVDDICDGGATFEMLADELKGRDLKLYLWVTHGIFSKGTAELKRRYRKIFCSDSLPAREGEQVTRIAW